MSRTQQQRRVADQFHRAAAVAQEVADAAERDAEAALARPCGESFQVEQPPAERLRQLRAAWPGWSVQYREGHTVAWVAERRYRAGWRGGHSVCEAETADVLDYLLAQAVQTDAVVAAVSERARRMSTGDAHAPEELRAVLRREAAQA
ncbi:hypothetical protein SAMN05443665_101748 [Actinomadura meyerae]|uniref:Uncharacterized protein n=1 Tax=Actinomadura meyerae TaxID=240840 RepID=A0A239K9G6_9ACTN|nr:hypothetical protein [Actinomadura meyerae]SNT14283.1 hypothetical protein SAMN05443665_101748 [Actinomadura meyerae]